MNAIVYKITPPVDKETVETICFNLHERNFERAEALLLDLIEEMMTREYNTSDDRKDALACAKILYYTFNAYYDSWAQKKGLNIDQEKKALHSPVHDNILFAHCTDPESMDDLMYEVCQYLTEIENDSQMEEAQYHLDCYKRLI